MVVGPRNPRVGDVVIVVVLEMLEDVSTAVRGLIGTGIVCSVCDGIAINQGNLV